jgi:hypothetical protein
MATLESRDMGRQGRLPLIGSVIAGAAQNANTIQALFNNLIPSHAILPGRLALEFARRYTVVPSEHWADSGLILANQLGFLANRNGSSQLRNNSSR